MKVERPAWVPAELGSQYEAWVWQALVSLGHTPLLQQTFRGGVGMAGGMAVDFVLLALMVVVRVMSYWHQDPGVQARDEYQKAYLQGQGYRVVDVNPQELGGMAAIRGWLQRELGTPTA